MSETLDLADIAVRLRGSISGGWSGDAAAADADNAEEAAGALIVSRDTIASQQAKIEELTKALEWIVDIADKNYEQDETLRSKGARTLIRISEKAAAALKGAA